METGAQVRPRLQVVSQFDGIFSVDLRFYIFALAGIVLFIGIALHIAVAIGRYRIMIRNREGLMESQETPTFLAIRHSKRKDSSL